MNDKFINIFTGLERNFGYCNIEKGFVGQDGKIEFDPKDLGWSKRAITSQDYENHLTGKQSIGIQPCTEEGMAKFGAIDIDDKQHSYTDFPYKKYLDLIAKHQIPVIPIKSKSGGLHLFVFTKEFVKASIIRTFLQDILFLLGLPQEIEVYPKQTELGESSGNFINLPYYKKTERLAFNFDGKFFDYEQFLKLVQNNLQTPESLDTFTKKIIQDELTGGAAEFIDGPPCLARLTKEKMTDNRERFLYNYSVFAKKKYPDNWEDKVKEAAREYFVYDSKWDDSKVEGKIRDWKKSKSDKGYTCSQDPIAPLCLKQTCYKRKYGVLTNVQISWPTLSGLTRIEYRPDPEFWLTVQVDEENTKQVIVKNIDKLVEMRELRKVIAAQTSLIPPKIKDADFQKILDPLWKNLETLDPPEGTSDIDILKAHIVSYVNEMKATSHASLESGATYDDGEYFYFVYDKFYDHLKTKEWKLKQDRTGVMIKKQFKGELSVQVRYPHKKGAKMNPRIRCVRLLKNKFIQEDAPDEQIQMRNIDELM